MDVVQAFLDGEITLNEARHALGLSPDPILGKHRRIELIPTVYVEKEMSVEEYLAQFDELEKLVSQALEEVVPGFEKEWIRFIRRFQINRIRQKSMQASERKRYEKRMKDKIRRETNTLADLLNAYSQRIIDKMEEPVERKLYEIQKHLPQPVDWDDFFQESAKKLAQEMMQRYQKRVTRIIQQASDEGWDEQKLDKEVDHFWESVSQRARMVSETNAIHLSNAWMIRQYEAFGFQQKMWKAEPGACPICSSLNGKIQELQEAFYQENERIQDPEQPEKEIEITRNIPHPPAHPHCRCFVVPVVKGSGRDLDNKPQLHTEALTRPMVNHWRKPVLGRRDRNYARKVKNLLASETQDIHTLLKVGKILHNEIEHRYAKIFQEYDQLIEQLNPYLQKVELTKEEEIKRNELIIQVHRLQQRKEERLRNIRKRVLSQFIDFGYGLKDRPLPLKFWDINGNTPPEEIRKSLQLDFVKNLAPHLPRWILKKISQKKLRIVLLKGGRSGYNPIADSILLGTFQEMPETFRPLTQSSLMHELMHRLEEFDQTTNLAELAYYFRRRDEVDPKQPETNLYALMRKRRMIAEDANMENTYGRQKAFDCGFTHFYLNAYYPGDDLPKCELITKGIEYLFGGNGLPDNERFDIERDEEYLHFLYGWVVSQS